MVSLSAASKFSSQPNTSSFFSRPTFPLQQPCNSPYSHPHFKLYCLYWQDMSLTNNSANSIGSICGCFHVVSCLDLFAMLQKLHDIKLRRNSLIAASIASVFIQPHPTSGMCFTQMQNAMNLHQHFPICLWSCILHHRPIELIQDIVSSPCKGHTS